MTYICGTLRNDRKENPKDVVKKKLKKGEMFWKRKGTVVTKWKDKLDVLTITNKHKVEMVQTANRRGQEKMKPNVIKDYNHGMSGVDRSDQMLSYYQGLRKSVRWYKKIGFHFLEMYLFNSFCLYNKVNPASTKRLQNFRIEVVMGLIGGIPKDPIHNIQVSKIRSCSAISSRSYDPKCKGILDFLI